MNEPRDLLTCEPPAPDVLVSSDLEALAIELFPGKRVQVADFLAPGTWGELLPVGGEPYPGCSCTCCRPPPRVRCEVVS